MLEDDACMLEDEEDEEDEEVSEDAAASSWPVADMSGRRSMEEVRRGLWLRSMLAPHWSLARTLIYGRAVTRGDKSDTGHSPSSSWQFHGPSGMFDKVRKNLQKIETNFINFIYFGQVQGSHQNFWPRNLSFLLMIKLETCFPAKSTGLLVLEIDASFWHLLNLLLTSVAANVWLLDQTQQNIYHMSEPSGHLSDPHSQSHLEHAELKSPWRKLFIEDDAWNHDYMIGCLIVRGEEIFLCVTL